MRKPSFRFFPVVPISSGSSADRLFGAKGKRPAIGVSLRSFRSISLYPTGRRESFRGAMSAACRKQGERWLCRMKKRIPRFEVSAFWKLCRTFRARAGSLFGVIDAFDHDGTEQSCLLQRRVGFPRVDRRPCRAFGFRQIQVADQAVEPCVDHLDLDLVVAMPQKPYFGSAVIVTLKCASTPLISNCQI